MLQNFHPVVPRAAFKQLSVLARDIVFRNYLEDIYIIYVYRHKYTYLLYTLE